MYVYIYISTIIRMYRYIYTRYLHGCLYNIHPRHNLII